MSDKKAGGNQSTNRQLLFPSVNFPRNRLLRSRVTRNPGYCWLVLVQQQLVRPVLLQQQLVRPVLVLDSRLHCPERKVRDPFKPCLTL